MYYTVKQVADKLQVSSKTIRRRIEDGSISIIRLGAKTIRIEESALNQYIDGRKAHWPNQK